MNRLALTAKRVPGIRGDSSDHESAEQPRRRQRVVKRALASQDDSDQPGGTSCLERVEQPGRRGMARKASDSQLGVKQILRVSYVLKLVFKLS